MPAKPVWLRETAWIGAEGVAEKVEKWAGVNNDRCAKTLDHLLDQREWKGATVTAISEGFATVTHPSGSTARVRLEPLEPQTCGRTKCKAPVSRCKKCQRRLCQHTLCSCTETNITYLHGVNP